MAITSYKAVVGYYNSAGTPSITTAVTGQLSDGWIPIGAPILTDAYGQCTQMMAKTDATPVIATSAYTVVTAANPQPPDATWDAQGEPLWIDTTTYLQAYTKGGAYLQGTVPVSRGGTGATTTLAAAANLRVFAIPNNLSEITDRSAAWLNIRPTGPLPLGGDPVNDYDATTMRWVKNYVDAGGGGGGASMNGVMNYGVGQITLWHSRAFIPAYAVVADGQLLSRTAYPELWAHAQMHAPIADSLWVANVNNRAKFSTGDGSTTFRVPDLNGVQTGSVGGMFGRGDAGGFYPTGTTALNGLPNITATLRFHGSQFDGQGGTVVSDATGVAYQAETQSRYSGPNLLSGAGSAGLVVIDASRASNVYGRSTEVVPNSFVGVWIIRANGGFTATNTQWQVVNADSTLPVSGVETTSGVVKTQYNVGGVVESETKLYNNNIIGGYYRSVLSVYNKTKNVTSTFSLRDDGQVETIRYSSTDKNLMPWTDTGLRRGSFSTANANVAEVFTFNSILSGSQQTSNGYKTSTHIGNIHYNLGSFAQSTWVTSGDDNAAYSTRLAIQPVAQDVYLTCVVGPDTYFYTLQKAAVSDANMKHDIVPTTVDKAWSNLSSLQFVNFVYNGDEQNRVRRGVIAQQAETVDPLYVKTIDYHDNNGKKVKQKQLDTTPMLLDTIHVVQKLIAEIDALKAEVAFLKSGK